ncbi:PREDICTED: E3 ubiquitin-protein ligase RNF138 [Nanorana parkeri]|uniref:E3 ubiquitin-protein ligase RNF138 n=1 Tax=Nanorana parkeri TaxID=125878 RepID=UPI000854B3FF|nr:PREDICTED: E3 ubiquitin-protein ligase RNF138 [Nanorana parkeri]
MEDAAIASSSAASSHDKEDFCCPVCQEIFQTPVRTQSCHHVFCRKCLLSAVKACGAHCPLCRGALCRWERSAPTRASDIEIQMRTISAGCMYCGKQVKLSYMRLHYKSCKSYQEEYGFAPKVSKEENTTCVTKPLDKTYTCPLCLQQDLNRQALLDHCIFLHYFEDAQAVCPICCSVPWANSAPVTENIVAHLNARHRFSYEDFMNVYLDEDAQYQAAIEKSCQSFT